VDRSHHQGISLSHGQGSRLRLARKAIGTHLWINHQKPRSSRIYHIALRITPGKYQKFPTKSKKQTLKPNSLVETEIRTVRGENDPGKVV
jgi:hypothetical protein